MNSSSKIQGRWLYLQSLVFYHLLDGISLVYNGLKILGNDTVTVVVLFFGGSTIDPITVPLVLNQLLC